MSFPTTLILNSTFVQTSTTSLVDYADGATADCFACPGLGPPFNDLSNNLLEQDELGISDFSLVRLVLGCL